MCNSTWCSNDVIWARKMFAKYIQPQTPTRFEGRFVKSFVIGELF